MVKLYVTYGLGSNLKNCYSVISAETIDECFKIIDSVAEGKYAFTYTESEFEGQVEKYELREVPLQKQIMYHDDDE